MAGRDKFEFDFEVSVPDDATPAEIDRLVDKDVDRRIDKWLDGAGF